MTELPLNIDKLQFIEIVSNTKHYIVKLLDTSTQQNIKLKYIQINPSFSTQIYVSFLQNLSILQHKNNLTKYLNKKLWYQVMKKDKSKDDLILIKDQFKNEVSLARYFNCRIKNKSNRLIVNRHLLLLLFDQVFKHLSVNHLVVNCQNLYIRENGDLSINGTSFIGVQLIIFNHGISKEEFKKIYPYLDSNILQRKSSQRINFKQKLKNLGALILELIMDGPLKLLQFQEIPDEVNLQMAKELLSKSKEKYKKLLKYSILQGKIAKLSQDLSINLKELLVQLLVNEKEMKWSQVKNIICPCHHSESKQSDFIQEMSKEIYSKLNQFEKNHLKSLHIIDNRPNLTADYELLMIYMLKQEIKQLKYGSLIDEMANHKEFNLKKTQIVTKCLQYILKEHELCQSKIHLNHQQQNPQKSDMNGLHFQVGMDIDEVSLRWQYDQPNLTDQEDFLQYYYQLAQSSKRYPSLMRQQEYILFNQQEECQNLNETSHMLLDYYKKQSNQSFKNQEEYERKLLTLIDFHQSQYIRDERYKEKLIRIQHDRSKCLKLYKNFFQT